MLIALVYHKISNDKGGNPLDLLEKHFAYIASCFPTLLPGDPLPRGLSVCLTFDDAYFDFYALIFPLLEKYGLKALLAVPTAFILEKTSLDTKHRLSMITPLLPDSPPLPSPAFCTWQELQTLATSPLIQIASHSLHHRPLTSLTDPQTELTASKKVLKERLSLPISSFVYPFGKFNAKIHAMAKQEYRYVFRLGSAHNLSWGNGNTLAYRICGDGLQTPRYPFTPFSLCTHTLRLFFHRIRGR